MIAKIGHTPLTKSTILSNKYRCQVFIKEDYHNPGMSSKDRAALYMIRDGEIKGFLQPGGTIVEASSGNTGIGLAIVAKELNYQCHIFMSKKGSSEKVTLLKQLGARVTICDNSNGPHDPDSSQSRAKAYADTHANTYFCNQYFSQANADAHYYGTGPEIWEQCPTAPTHILIGVGTGGTISGIGRYFKEHNPQVKILGIDPHGSILTQYHRTGTIHPKPGKYLIEGIGRNFIPGTLDFSVVDDFIQITDRDAVTAAYAFKRATGFLAGFSSAAVLAALDQASKQQVFAPTDTVVLFFPDHGVRYMSKLYNAQWLETVLGCSASTIKALTT